MNISKIGVVGAGIMGSGIAEVAASSGFEVLLSDVNEDLTTKGRHRVAIYLNRSVDKGQLEQGQAKEILEKVRTTTHLGEMDSVDFIIEAVAEVEELKVQVFQELDRICGNEVILASNTSSIPVGRMGGRTSRPEKVIGMHFMNPAPRMKLVEVVRALATSEETFQTTLDLCHTFGKTPVVAKDFPGFMSNRILLPMINEAIFCLHQRIGRAEDIDTVMKQGMHHPMGPLELADYIGLDTCLAILKSLYDGFGDSKYRPCPLLKQYVEAGWLGRKSGKGFYIYE